MSRISVVGDAGVDVFVRVPRIASRDETLVGMLEGIRAGGMGANTARAAARMGAAVRLVAAIGDDAFGETVLDALRADGVDISAVHRVVEAATFMSFIQTTTESQTLVVAQTPATYPDPASLRRELFEGADVVHIAAGAKGTALRSAELATAAGALVAVDLDAAPPDPWPLIDLADQVLLNRQGAALLMPDERPERVVTALHQRRGARVVLTLGTGGILGTDGGEVVRAAARQVAAVDATGAGDTVAAVLAVSLAEGRSLPKTLRRASLKAAETVQRFGV